MLENITVNISAAELEKLVKDAVEKQFGKTATEISFNIRALASGYRHLERTEAVFDGATVKLVPRSTSH